MPAALLLVVVMAQPVRALGDLRLPVPGTAQWHAGRLTPGWQGLVVDAQPSDGTGLRHSGARAQWVGRRVGLAMQVVRVGSPVGHEAAWRAGAGGSRGNTWLWAHAEHNALTIGAHRQSLGTLGARARVPVGSRLVVVAAVSGIRIYGVDNPGADTELDVWLAAGGAVHLNVGVSVHRRYGAAIRVGTRARLADRFSVAGGYDAAVESLHTSVGIRVGAVSVDAGVTSHAVLGLTRVVALRWNS